MTLVLPREILNRFEQRWSARVMQAEGFQAAADRLKPTANGIAEDAASLADRPVPPKQATIAQRK
jgi:hypothetical protein